MDQSDCLYCSGYVDGTIICIGAKYYRKGQVLDAKSKEPLIGVSVLEKVRPTVQLLTSTEIMY